MKYAIAIVTGVLAMITGWAASLAVPVCVVIGLLKLLGVGMTITVGWWTLILIAPALFVAFLIFSGITALLAAI